MQYMIRSVWEIYCLTCKFRTLFTSNSYLMLTEATALIKEKYGFRKGDVYKFSR
jgi:hypothetical protein